jgi:hypothetical protein
MFDEQDVEKGVNQSVAIAASRFYKDNYLVPEGNEGEVTYVSQTNQSTM